MTSTPEIHEIAQLAVNYHGANQDTAELEQLITYLVSRETITTVVEIGCDRGGSLWLWRQLAPYVFAVTLHTRADRVFDDHGATVIVGDSTNIKTQRQLRRALGGLSPDLVFIDGGHDEGTVRSDLDFAMSLVRRGLIVFHDIASHQYADWSDVHKVWTTLPDDGKYTEIIRDYGTTPGYGIIEIGG